MITVHIYIQWWLVQTESLYCRYVECLWAAEVALKPRFSRARRMRPGHMILVVLWLQPTVVQRSASHPRISRSSKWVRWTLYEWHKGNSWVWGWIDHHEKQDFCRPDLQGIAGCVWSPSHQKNALSVFCLEEEPRWPCWICFFGSTVESRGLALLVA